MKAVCPVAFSNDESPEKEEPSVVTATLKLALTAYSTAIEATLKAGTYTRPLFGSIQALCVG